MNFAQETETLIRARYPILYVVSSEESRVQQLVVEIAQRRQKKVFEWSCSTGIVPVGTSIQSQKHRNAPTKEPLLALDQVIDQVEPAIFLFKDFHPFLTRSNHAVVRKLKEDPFSRQAVICLWNQSEITLLSPKISPVTTSSTTAFEIMFSIRQW